MSVAALTRFFAAHSECERLVLATVYQTAGSTYSKAGARMLINAAGDFQGMLSGGCLEGDLADRAQQVTTTGVAQSVTYDMRGEDDVLWGLGVGCEGMMRILLQPLNAADGFAPFPEIAAVLQGEQRGAIATVVASSSDSVRPGAALVSDGTHSEACGVSDSVRAALDPLLAATIDEARSSLHAVEIDGRSLEVLLSVLEPPPRVLILGAGLDAEPLLKLCVDLGWRVTVQDHRASYIEKGDFSAAENVLCVPAVALTEHLELADFDAAVVMSHHLLTDKEYLAQLAGVPLNYVGLLGPPQRRQRLMAELEAQRAGAAARPGRNRYRWTWPARDRVIDRRRDASQPDAGSRVVLTGLSSRAPASATETR